MLVALERDVAEVLAEVVTEVLGERGELAVEELVHERVRLGGDADRHAVGEREVGGRHEVGDRLADAGAGLDRQVRVRAEGLEDGLGHAGLLVARLVARVHAADGAVWGELAEHGVVVRGVERQLGGVEHGFAAVAAEALVAEGLEVCWGMRARAGNLRDDAAERPGLRRGARELSEHGVREVCEASEEDAPERGERVRIVERSVGAAVGELEGGREVREAVAAHARKGDAGEGEAVEPGAAEARGAAARRGEEVAVEARVVGDEVAGADEVRDGGDDAFDDGGVGDVSLGDAGELRRFRGDGVLGADEGAEAVEHLGAPGEDDADLDDLVAAAVEAGGLEVDEREFVFEPEHGGLGALGQRGVRRGDIGVGSRLKEPGKRVIGHAGSVARGCDCGGVDAGGLEGCDRNADAAPRRAPHRSSSVRARATSPCHRARET